MSEIIASSERLEFYKSFQKKVTSVLFKAFLFAKLPSAFFSGVKVVSINNETCKTSVPFKWFSQNPFKSTYFATQAMAAELSTGLPGLMACDKRDVKVSLLVIKMEAEYFKKATSLTTFECTQVADIVNIVEEAVASKEARIIKVPVIGTDKTGDVISKFWFTWSFKAKLK